MLWCCPWRRGQRENNAGHLLGSSPLSNELSNSLSPTTAIAIVHSQLRVSVSHSANCWLGTPPRHSQPHPHGPLPHLGSKNSLWVLTGLVVLVDCFFNSLVVRVPSSLIFWHFWLFIDFRLVVILLLVVPGSEVFLPTPPSWPEPQKSTYSFISARICIREDSGSREFFAFCYTYF